MKPIQTFTVIPALPPQLERLRELAHNLRWAWNHDTTELFRRLDSDLWEKTHHNPVLMLGMIDQGQLAAAATDVSFLAYLDRVWSDFQAYLNGETTWFQRTHGPTDGPRFAYFSAEFGLTECLSIFAGGLGVLAGDHLKSASDLGVPLVGVGLLYQRGYLRQYLNEAGWQQEIYEDNDFANLPLLLERQADGTPLTIAVAYPERQVIAQVWRVQVGRVSLYLLDTNLPANRIEDRDITYQLYGGDLETRLKQEIMLGIGGYRALLALSLKPAAFHMNEGHAAFLALERVRHLMGTHHLSFAEAREAASASLAFTTHTPEAAGHDYFPPDLMERYFALYVQDLGLSFNDFLALGRYDPHNHSEYFCLTILALRMATHSNGVSQLHGQVTRRMWRTLWPGVPEHEIPIRHITNGVHFESWISREMKDIYERYLGPQWREEPANHTVWQRAEHISTEELWRTHERRRERLVSFARRRLRAQLARRGASQMNIEMADEILDPGILTIGFARRFAPYKRATLLLRDPERLARILNNPDRPVQVIFAGKAHPRNDPGKELIQQIVVLARQDHFRRRVVFLEDYDMAVARYLVQGVDVWLNTPLRPQEASGTSGMKAMANGVLTLSILDGWWAEAYQPHVGWAIGSGETYDNRDYQDQVEAQALYDSLEQDVIPVFYNRGNDGLPRQWIARMKASTGALCYFFNTHRMVQEYTERFYLPSADHYQQFTANEAARAKNLATWRMCVRDGWPQVRIETVESEPFTELQVGVEFWVRATVYLGDLTPDDVRVELYLGRVDAAGELLEAETMPMQFVKQAGIGRYCFEATAVSCYTSGRHGYTVRVLPHHADLITPFLPGLIVWA
jgi:starch phosphorylase